jgi:hypothetical protein
MCTTCGHKFTPKGFEPWQAAYHASAQFDFSIKKMCTYFWKEGACIRFDIIDGAAWAND